jgi:hypothetical protein
MRRFRTFLAALLFIGAYSAMACSSDDEKTGGGSGGRAGAAGSSSGQAGSINACLPRACCRDGVVTTTYGECMQLTTTCTLGCRADLPVMGCVTINALGGEQEARTFADSVCIPDPNAGTGGVAGTAGTGGVAGLGMGGEGGASEGGAGGEGGASDGGMGGEGGR